MTEQDPRDNTQSGMPGWLRTLLIAVGVVALAMLGIVVVIVGLIIGVCGGKC